MINDFVSLFFPRVCLACAGSLDKGLEELCVNCLKELPKTENHVLPIPEFEERFSGIIDFKSIYVYLFFQKRGIVQKLLHELKYSNRPDIGEMLGKWYGHELSLNDMTKGLDFIIPIPLHQKKLRARGYNQSEHFAAGMSRALDIPCLPHGLIKTRTTDSQTNKSRIERMENVKGVFEVVNPDLMMGKRILLVDDVLTTGSTLVTAGSTLLDAGAASISFAVIAAAK